MRIPALDRRGAGSGSSAASERERVDDAQTRARRFMRRVESVAGDQPDRALVAEVRPRPLHHHDDAVAEADQIEDVHEQPGEPADQPLQLHPAEDRRPPRRGRSSPCCRGRDTRNGRSGCPSIARRMLRAACAPICIATCATPGSGRPFGPVERRQVADHEDVRMPGNREIRVAPARGRRDRAARRASRPSGDAATPAAHRIVCGLDARRRPSRRTRRPMRVTSVPVRTSTPSRSRSRRAASRSGSGNVGEHRRAAFEQDDPRGARDRNGGSPCASDCRAISASAPASSTPVGPPPTMTKVSSARRRAGSALALGALEGEQHAAPHLERVFERLQAGRVRPPLVVPEVGVRRARPRRSGSRRRAPRRRRRCDGCAPRSMRATSPSSTSTFALVPQDPADRRRDVAGRQRRHRDLVQQRLEDVMVAAVDDGHVDRRRLERARGVEPAEPPPTIRTRGTTDATSTV